MKSPEKQSYLNCELLTLWFSVFHLITSLKIPYIEPDAKRVRKHLSISQLSIYWAKPKFQTHILGINIKANNIKSQPQVCSRERNEECNPLWVSGHNRLWELWDETHVIHLLEFVTRFKREVSVIQVTAIKGFRTAELHSSFKEEMNLLPIISHK
jgi:hypothetical protein